MKIWWFISLLFCSAAFAGDLSRLVADRAAIEHVYYNHRLGDKPSFEQALSREMLEKLVRLDIRKESVLKSVYGVEVTPAMVEAELQRINTTTRAPAILAELRAAVDNDPGRFAQTVARPMLVERELRSRFDNDDLLHGPGRRQVEQVRKELLAVRGEGVAKQVALLKSRHPNEAQDTTWQLTGCPTESGAVATNQIEIQKRFGPDAQILSSPTQEGKEGRFYFEDLPAELQRVLRAQLRQAGDVSAVIETPGGFLLYVTKEKTDSALSVTGLTLVKRSYEQWLEGF